MRLRIVAVGRAKAAPELALADLYCERALALGLKLGFSKVETIVIDTSRGATTQARMAEEAEKLTAKIPQAAHAIALDEQGRVLASEDFASLLAKLRDSGTRDLVFLIGGPDGLAPSLKARMQMRLAFGAQTWPHLLVRAMLAEQIYRAFAILAGHPYHRGRSES